MTSHGLLCYCRPGFEPELAAELTERAAVCGLGGYARTERNSGYVVFVGDDGIVLTQALPFRELIFARQKLRLIAELRDLEDIREQLDLPAAIAAAEAALADEPATLDLDAAAPGEADAEIR